MIDAKADEEPISAICYVSEARSSLDKLELNDLVRRASESNFEHKISGFLCLHKGRYFQYLEGRHDAVQHLIAQIVNDRRHKVLNTIDLGTTQVRRYADWSMMRVNPASRGINSLVEAIMHIAVDQLIDRRFEDSAQSTLLSLLDCLSEDSMRENIEAEFIGKKIIAIGASAGGIAPIKQILADLPKDIDASILLVLHLSPSHKTVLDEILQRDTGFPVELAKDNDLLLPGKVNLIPPSKNIQVQAGRIRVLEQLDRQSSSGAVEHNVRSIPYPVDILFSNLARQHGRKVIGIVLSGSGNDGARGAKHLQEEGAIVIAQNPETAEFEGMPGAVVSAGAVDRALELDEIGPFVTSLVKSHSDSGVTALSAQDLEVTENILSMLAEHDIDFTGYKRQTIINRIQRRRALVEARTLQDYYAELLVSETERALIKNDLLISVTEFFRDKPAWELLRGQIQTQLLTNLSADEVIRVWIAGCATGEEAYTMAIVLMELLGELEAPNDFKIFATDLSESSLRIAATGAYKCASVMAFSEEQLRKYFHRYDDGYQISTLIKEKVIFSHHNLVRDAPFTNMHIVCCRNVIIYMDTELQSRVLRTLHFALQLGGILFLGPSESTGVLAREFSTPSHEWNLHVKQRDKRIPLQLDAKNKHYRAERHWVQSVNTLELTSNEEADLMYQQGIEALCLSQHKTAVIINSKKTVDLVICDPNGLLEVAKGQPGAGIDKLLVGSLVPPVVVSLQRLLKTDQVSVTSEKVNCIDNHGNELKVDISIHALKVDNADLRWLLTFKPVTDNTNKQPGYAGRVDGSGETTEDIVSVKNALSEAEETLYETVRELELSNNEQKDAFEQLTAANEELQSTNEELQSVNEELYTVNFEYQSKIHELSDITNDLNNLMRCTDLGVVFIDSELRIRKFTEQAGRIADLAENDIGRPASDIGNRLNCNQLSEHIARVMSLNKSEELDIHYRECDARLHLGIYPYTVESEFCQGVVLTMLDLATLETFSVSARSTAQPDNHPDSQAEQLTVAETID
ncbi:MAG: chemotaxis protein CheB [Pseudomonadota bacterium]